jgi:oligopeptide transport system substrate-binding protein
MIRFFLVFFLTSLTGCFLSPKEKKETQKQVLRINIGDEPQILDPRRARSLNDIALLRHLFEGLTRKNPQNKIELALAKDVQISDDGRSYRFTLIKSYWSNEDLLTAYDFAYAWHKVLDPKFPSDMAHQMYLIKNAQAVKEGKLPSSELGVRVLSDTELEVELEHPAPYFLELLSFPLFFPVHRQLDTQNPNWCWQDTTYISNGPFILAKWDHRSLVRLHKNPLYWDSSSVFLSEVLAYMLSEEAELRLFEKGDIDWAGSPLSTLPIDSLNHLKGADYFMDKEFLGTYLVRIQTQKPPFNNVLVRRGFALAINRNEITSHITQGNQVAATGLVPIGLGLQDNPYFLDADLEKAKSLLQQDFPKVRLLYRADEKNHVLAQALQQQWAKALGVEVELEAVESKIYFDRISKGDYQLATGSWIADFEDPINFLEIFKYKTGGSNNTGWEDAHYIQLLNSANKTADNKQRRVLLKQAEQILIDHMPIIPIFYYRMLYLNRNIDQVALSSTGGIDFKWAKVDKK